MPAKFFLRASKHLSVRFCVTDDLIKLKMKRKRKKRRKAKKFKTEPKIIEKQKRGPYKKKKNERRLATLFQDD